MTPAGFASHKHIIGPLLAHLHSKLIKQATLESTEQLPVQHEDPFVQLLHRIIRLGLKFLALLMVIVILRFNSELYGDGT